MVIELGIVSQPNTPDFSFGHSTAFDLKLFSPQGALLVATPFRVWMAEAMVDYAIIVPFATCADLSRMNHQE